jgi:hypothetical protein
MLFCGICGFEAQFGGDFCARGWRARACDGALDKVKNLLLSGSEFGAF